MAEVRLVDAGGHDEAVVRDVDGFEPQDAAMDDPPIQVESRYFGQLDLDVFVLAHHMSNRNRDLARRYQPGGHLVEEGLKEVVIAAVNERDINRLAAE